VIETLSEGLSVLGLLEGPAEIEEHEERLS
jgi:hypothetical protein